MASNRFDEQKLAYKKAIEKQQAAFDVNPVIVTDDNRIVLAKRIPNDEQGGRWSFPGGKVFVNERIETSLKRMSLLKTGLTVELMYPSLNENLIGVYDDPKRDPRSHVDGLAFLCRMVGGEMKPGGNSEKVEAFPIEKVKELELAFDHRLIYEDTLKILKQRGRL